MRSIIVVALAFSSTCLQADQWTRSYAVGANPTLDIQVSDANVTLHTGASGTIQAYVTSEGYEFRPGDVEIRDSQSGDRVEIVVKHTQRSSNDFSRVGNRWVRVALTVPPQVAAAIKTGDGNIEASGLRGQLRFVTGDGNITADRLSGTLEARTGDGNVTVAGQFSGVNANTGDGNIDIRVLPGSQGQADWRLVTGDGDVRLHLPSDLRASVDVRTGDGRIDSDLALANVRRSDKDRDDGDLRADLNGGGSLVSVRTGDGNVSLHTAR